MKINIFGMWTVINTNQSYILYTVTMNSYTPSHPSVIIINFKNKIQWKLKSSKQKESSLYIHQFVSGRLYSSLDSLSEILNIHTNESYYPLHIYTIFYLRPAYISFEAQKNYVQISVQITKGNFRNYISHRKKRKFWNSLFHHKRSWKIYKFWLCFESVLKVSKRQRFDCITVTCIQGLFQY